MKKFFIPYRDKIIPKEAFKEIKKFDFINKSPYSFSFYNSKNITWDYKPEGSIRVSDHWNFISKGKKHCILKDREEKVEGEWILGKYIEGSYEILKYFGEGDEGYRFIEISEDDIILLKELYNNGGIYNSKKWYKEHKKRGRLIKEGHVKKKKVLLKHINIDKLNNFKEKNKNVKKIVYIEESYLERVKSVLSIYDRFKDFDEFNIEEIKKLSDEYNIYDFKEELLYSYEEKIILLLNNKIAVDFKI